MKNVRAFALVFTLAMTTLIILMAGTFFFITFNDLSLANTIADGTRAYYMAEAGIAKKFMELRDGSMTSTSGSITLAAGRTGSYSVAVTLTQAGIFPRYRLTSTGSYGNATKVVELTVKQISIARFAYLSNNENQLFWGWQRPIWFTTGDIIRGPLHTNDQLNISYDPIFEGPVSSVNPAINYYHGGPPTDNPEFRDSLTLGAPNVQLPTSADMIANIRDASLQVGGSHFNGDTAITFLANGTMQVTNAGLAPVTQTLPLPSNGAIFVDNGYLDVSGTLNGIVTAGTNRSIYVVNSLLYLHDPRTDPTSTDMLGLVAQNNIYIDTSAPYNVEVDAYLVALNTSFSVASYQTGLKGMLTVLGGITQERRGPVGTFNGTTGEKVSGYTKDYIYDERLGNSSPIYFGPARDSSGRIIYLKVLWAEY